MLPGGGGAAQEAISLTAGGQTVVEPPVLVNR